MTTEPDHPDSAFSSIRTGGVAGAYSYNTIALIRAAYSYDPVTAFGFDPTYAPPECYDPVYRALWRRDNVSVGPHDKDGVTVEVDPGRIVRPVRHQERGAFGRVVIPGSPSKLEVVTA
jgi:hypothetical protein